MNGPGRPSSGWGARPLRAISSAGRCRLESWKAGCEAGRTGRSFRKPLEPPLTFSHSPFKLVLPSSAMLSDIADMRFVRVLAPALAALLVTACQPMAQSKPAATPAASSSASAFPSATPSPTPEANHVFVIVLENTSYQLALR